MKLILLLFFLMTTNFASLYSASNDDPIFYDEIGGWEIGILPYLNFGCYTSSPVYEGGEMLSVYVDNRQNAKNVYLHLVNPVWSSLQVGDIHEMGVIFEPFADKWIGEAEVVSYGDHKGIEFVVGTEFLVTFAKMDSIRFTYNDRDLLGLVLDGSYNAAVSLAQCQELVAEVGTSRNSINMKRKLKKPSSRDPFRQ